MTHKIVNIEALNIRSRPLADPSNLRGVLHLGQTLTAFDEDPGADWINVKALVRNIEVTGYVKRVVNDVLSLREPATAPREALAGKAIEQWLRFDRGQGKEHDKPYSSYVGEMWRSIKLNFDGSDRNMPWSAAFISFIVRQTATETGSYANFKFASSHSRYLHDSIVKKASSDTSVPFWGYRLDEKMPQVGDIVASWRETESNYNDAAHTDSFKSHCDIIISVNSDFALAIGGNVSQSVNITRFEKSNAGFLLPSRQAFMLMANRA